MQYRFRFAEQPDETNLVLKLKLLTNPNISKCIIINHNILQGKRVRNSLGTSNSHSTEIISTYTYYYYLYLRTNNDGAFKSYTRASYYIHCI